ncbi:PAN domain-containing protein [Algimonas arctica]|uniref:PAN domain-containing protein n=1 Tax=Algimonas arctica TaxID=1479486 RepID=UPI00167724A2|nr:PAN domain-containing protein [Algimonas arctica]
MRLTLLSCTVALIAAPAFAADLGTYRPGTPYHSVIVPTANVCESQCEGDAQCRGWNYVKAAQTAPGVCEFQSTISAPVSSAISISGVSESAMPMSTRVIEGNTNTIRVGTAVAPKPIATTQTSQSGRQIVRHPVPEHYSQGLYSQPPSTPQMGFRPALDGYTAAQPQMTPPTLTRGPARQSPQMRNVRPTAPQNMSQPAYQPPQYSQPYQGRPPIGQPITPTSAASVQGQYAPTPQIIPAQTQAQIYRQPQGQTQAHGQPQPYMQAPSQPMPSQPMPRSSVNNPVSWDSIRQTQTAPQQQSLYGQLNDDVRSSAPMPTVPSYPTQPVSQLPLAGAQPR